MQFCFLVAILLCTRLNVIMCEYHYSIRRTLFSGKTFSLDTFSATVIPTAVPSAAPTAPPTFMPTTSFPTSLPTAVPSVAPTAAPTFMPTTSFPTSLPTAAPSVALTPPPTFMPTTSFPTSLPTGTPTFPAPTSIPTLFQTNVDMALCGFIAATNIQSKYSQWSCDPEGYTETDPCFPVAWPGLGGCVNQEPSVIILGIVGLIGSLPTALGQMTSLTQLTLSYNSFNGSIPSQLSQLTALASLQVQSNLLSGSISSDFCAISSLQLDISSTAIACYADCLTNVIGSVACNTTAPTSTPTSVPTAARMNEDIGLCGFIAATNISSATGYNEWTCDSAGYTSSDPCGSPIWTGLTCNSAGSVTAMRVSGLEITGTISSSLSELISLTALEVYQNLLKGTVPSSLSTLNSLHQLNLQSNAFSGSISSDFCAISSLQLDISSTAITCYADCLTNVTSTAPVCTGAPSTTPSAMPTASPTVSDFPTSHPSMSPTLHVGSVILQFESMLDYVNVTSSEMDGSVAAQSAALMATAESFGFSVTVDQLRFINATAAGASLISRQLRAAALSTKWSRRLTASCTVAIQITVPIEQLNTTNIVTAYVALTDQLQASVMSGAYTSYLANASILLSATETMFVTVPRVVSTSAVTYYPTSASPTLAPTTMVMSASSFWKENSLAAFYAALASVMFLTGLFIFYMQVTFHCSVLNLRGGLGEVAAVVTDYGLISLSLYLFLSHMSLYGGNSVNKTGLLGLNPFEILLFSRIVAMIACTYILSQLFHIETPDEAMKRRNRNVAVDNADMQGENIDDMPLISLLYRPSLGYNKFTAANTIEDSVLNSSKRGSKQKPIASTPLFDVVFPAYVVLILFAMLETRLLKRLPWIKTEKSVMLNGYPSMNTARVCLYGRMCTQGLQLWSSLLNDSSDKFYVVLSLILFIHSMISTATFLKMTQADDAKLAVVGLADLVKISDYKFNKQEVQEAATPSAYDENAVMPFEALRASLAIEALNPHELDFSEFEVHDKDDQPSESEEESEDEDELVSGGCLDGIEMSDMKAKPVYSTTVEYAEKTTAMLMQQLKDAGKVAIVYIPLDKLNAEIAQLMAALNAGKPYDEARLDYLLLCLDANPEYKAEKEKELQQWKKSVKKFANDSLREMRTFISAGIFKHSVASLQAESGYSVGLCRRLLTKKCLWLTRISTEDICRMHEADLLNKFNPLSQGLDIVEIAAVYAQLPDKFVVDPSGKKETFRLSVVSHMKELMIKKEQGTLSKSQARNALYTAAVPCYVKRRTLHNLSRHSVGEISMLNPILATKALSTLDNCGPDDSTNDGFSFNTTGRSHSVPELQSSSLTTARQEAAALAAGGSSHRPPPVFASLLDSMVKKRQASTNGGEDSIRSLIGLTESSSTESSVDTPRAPPPFANSLQEMIKKRQTSVVKEIPRDSDL